LIESKASFKTISGVYGEMLHENYREASRNG